MEKTIKSKMGFIGGFIIKSLLPTFESKEKGGNVRIINED